MTFFLLSVLLVGARAADAACAISGARLIAPPPAAGQQFSFIATAGCDKLRFRVPGTTFVAIPKDGPDTGTKDRTYKVVLTESEWNSLVDEGDTTFNWSIIGTTSDGETTRMTTTSDLEGGVTIDLSMADAKLVGEEAGDHAGGVAGAGDVDGDGRDDLLIGATGNDEGGTTGGGSAGAAYLVRGPVTGTLDLSLADAKLVGEDGIDGAGRVAGAGDVDGDGLDDLLVGAPGARSDRPGSSLRRQRGGAAYVVLGPVTGTLDLALADAKLLGVRGEQFAGSGVSGVGDVDNDGHDDMLVHPQNYSDGGHFYLVRGPVSGARNLARADATLVAEEVGDLMIRGTGAGDVNADGYDDLVTGAFENDEGGTDAGAAYLVLGPVTGHFDMSVADAKLVGEGAGDWTGAFVSGAGDVDNDGHDDLLILGNPGAYLVLGPASGTLDLSLADAKLVADAGAGAGECAGAGDVDADGFDDLLLGAPFYDGSGGAYVLLGPVTGTFDLSGADATLVGEGPNDYASAVAGAGDVDADGRADILVGAAFNDEGGSDAGAAYLLYGGGLF